MKLTIEVHPATNNYVDDGEGHSAAGVFMPEGDPVLHGVYDLEPSGEEGKIHLDVGEAGRWRVQVIERSKRVFPIDPRLVVWVSQVDKRKTEHTHEFAESGVHGYGYVVITIE